jgi:hypothetical protein
LRQPVEQTLQGIAHQQLLKILAAFAREVEQTLPD